jgi:alkanesulfonate monooxygenase SsuD/methylene tetrahydromethanopterin reductase-like flavin-dependent oxidoreductase (luciferase family)
VILGLGAGWHEPEYKALGLPFNYRVSRLEESAAALHELFETGTSSYQGRWVQPDDAQLLPRPSTKVPLWVAAFSPRMLQIAARYADGWNAAWFGSDSAPFVSKVAALNAAREREGAGARPLQLSAGVQLYVTRDGEEAEGLAAVAQINRASSGMEVEQVKRTVLLGDAHTVARTLERFQDAGASLAILAFPGLAQFPADDEALRRLFEDVPAALRRTAVV